MTAIAGLWAYGRPADAGRSCAAMLDALHAYGPHHKAVSQIDDCALGRALFRLLPEDDEDRQPLFGSGRRHALVADLRLDNRDELALALDLRIADVRRCSDAQILLYALERWGEEALGRIVGDYAFAWFDAAARRLLLVRDPLGQRPLFWHRGDGFVAFSSMPAGLHADRLVPRAPDEEAIARYVAGLTPAGESSFHRAVRRVQPARVVAITETEATVRRYWTPRRTLLRLPRFEDYVEAYRHELDRAVACRLRGAGAVVGAHLSGGWDSSAVAGTAARLVDGTDTRIAALTARPAGTARAAPNQRFSDEAPLAAEVAAGHAQIDHILVEGSGRSAVADLELYERLFDRPLYNMCNQGWLADIRSRARDLGARVILTGELGNWTISAAPNNMLAEFVAEGRWREWLLEASATLRQGRARLRGVAAGSFGPWLPAPLWKRLIRFSSGPVPGGRSAVHPALREELRREEELRDFGPTGRPRSRFERTAAVLEDVDFGEYRKGVLAGWHLDERDPTADVRVVEFCLSLPAEMLMSGGARRPLARAALADRVPAAVLDERRKGYQGADWGEALTRDLPAVEALVERIAADPSASRIVDTALVRGLLADWPEGGWERPGIIASYRIALLNALAAGHFLLAAPAAQR